MRNRVIICEASEMIAIGLAEIIDSMAQFDVVARLDSPEHLSEKITSSDANLLIVDPMLLGFHNKDFLSQLGKEHPQIIMIALVTSYLDHSMLTPYSGFIEIIGKVKTALFGGEGLFFATLEGPGTVWIQSLTLSRLAARLTSPAAQSTGEGSVLGGLGRLLDGKE